MTWLQLTIYGLACYRLAVLLSTDTGPFGMFSKLRSFLKREAKHNKPLRKSKVHLGIQCIRCDSMWIALPVAAFAIYMNLLPRWLVIAGNIFILWNALSAIVILVNRALPPRG